MSKPTPRPRRRRKPLPRPPAAQTLIEQARWIGGAKPTPAKRRYRRPTDAELLDQVAAEIDALFALVPPGRFDAARGLWEEFKRTREPALAPQIRAAIREAGGLC